MDKKNSSKKIAILALLAAFAMILSFVEALIPNIVPIPGFKLGLANFAVLLTLYLFGLGQAVLVDVVRILLTTFLFGSVMSLPYSLSAGIISILIQFCLIKTDKLSVIGVSAVGGVSHNIIQVVVGMIVLNSPYLVMYMPILGIVGLFSGIVIGLLVNILRKPLKRVVKNERLNE